MPHVIVEHTKALSQPIEDKKLLHSIHQTVIGSELFSADAVKTRQIGYDAICWGEDGISIDFVHVTVKILAGRTEAQRTELADAVFAVLEEALPDVPKLSVDIHEMMKQTYRKT